MIDRRLFVHAVFLTCAPIVVAWFGLSVPAAILLVLLLLLWRWLVVLSGFVSPAKTPELVLATISASHFVEKVRWSMDRLGLEYTEKSFRWSNGRVLSRPHRPATEDAHGQRAVQHR